MQNRMNAGGMLPRFVWTGLIAVLIPLAGCATAYRHENLTGGYSNFRLAETAYRVRFKGNNYTSREKVEQFLLYRCAQLTTQLGYEHFVVVAQDTLDISDLFAQAGTLSAQLLCDRAHKSRCACGSSGRLQCERGNAQD